MIRFILRRLLDGAIVLVVASVVVFSLLHLAPGDPASILAGPDATAETINAIRRDLGLDRPAVLQYFDWIGHVLSGDLGRSYIIRRPIAELISQRLGSTLALTTAAALMMVVIGTLLGVAQATSKSARMNRVFDAITGLALALPPFVSGVILIFLFAVLMRALPSGGDGSFADNPGDALRRLIMPGLALALPGSAVIGRLIATEMRRSFDQEFVLTALAKGARWPRITWRHVLPNSLGPAIIEVGIRVGQLLGGAIVAEAIFARAGLGSLLVQAVQMRDYRLAQVLLLMAITAAILAQILAEIVIARIDPRIRLGSKA